MLNLDWTKKSHKGLRRWIMMIVKDSPKSGAEIMDFMEANLMGWWRPSPGSVYPLLKTMVEEGVLTRSHENKYSLTHMGREEIEHPFPWYGKVPAQPRSVEGILDEMSSFIAYLEDLAQSKDGRIVENAGKIRELSERLSKVTANK